MKKYQKVKFARYAVSLFLVLSTDIAAMTLIADAKVRQLNLVYVLKNAGINCK